MFIVMRLWILCVMWYYGLLYYDVLFFFFKQKTAYEMRISDWSSDVCSSDLAQLGHETVRRIQSGRSDAPQGQQYEPEPLRQSGRIYRSCEQSKECPDACPSGYRRLPE